MGMPMHYRKMDREMTRAARDAATQVGDWAQDGYDSVRARPVMWSAASLGLGALAGGLYALWRNKNRFEGISLDGLWHWNGKANGRSRTMAARLRTKARRAKLKMNGTSEELSRQVKRAKRRR